MKSLASEPGLTTTIKTQKVVKLLISWVINYTLILELNFSVNLKLQFVINADDIS